MENASKTLIIAGAILISILLISLGVMVFSKAGDAVGSNEMSDKEIKQCNSRFIKYEGRQSGIEVKSLLNEIIASNAKEGNHYIVFTRGNDTNGKITTDWVDINSFYFVKIDYSNGIVNNIHIN